MNWMCAVSKLNTQGISGIQKPSNRSSCSSSALVIIYISQPERERERRRAGIAFVMGFDLLPRSVERSVCNSSTSILSCTSLLYSLHVGQKVTWMITQNINQDARSTSRIRITIRDPSSCRFPGYKAQYLSLLYITVRRYRCYYLKISQFITKQSINICDLLKRQPIYKTLGLLFLLGVIYCYKLIIFPMILNVLRGYMYAYI